MPLCPLQTGSPMMCCKNLSHIGPPWPNGLPGLPEAAQHCLFADTVLPCRTCRSLKTKLNVCQCNGPVCSRVCKPRSTGSTAICHPTCLLETLAVVKEGRLGRSPKASQSALPGQKCPRLPSREGKLGRFRPRLPSLEGKLGRPSQIALPGGQSGDSLPH